jgi:hypothetical protein
VNPQALASEAKQCRKLAPEFSGRPEQPFLLKLAAAFEELAVDERRRSRVPHTNQEAHVTAAPQRSGK